MSDLPIAPKTSSEPHTAPEDAETPRAPRKPPLDQSVQVKWAEQQLDESLCSPDFLLHHPFDASVKDVFRQLSTVRGDGLRAVLEHLEAEGTLDRLVDGLEPDEREQLLHLLEQSGLVSFTEQPWSPAQYAVRPPPLASGHELPPALENLVQKRNVEVNAEYHAAVDARAAAPRPAPGPVRADELAPARSLGRTPEEAARFELGARPSLDALLNDPVQAVRDGTKWALAQRDLPLRTRALEVGDETEVQLGADDSKLKVMVSRTADDRYELTLSADALLKLGGEFEGEIEGLEVAVGAHVGAGLAGQIKLEFSSPEELTRLLAALRTHAALDGKGRSPDVLAACADARQFIESHLKSASVALKQSSEVELGLEVLELGGKAEGKLEPSLGFERSRTADGRQATTVQQELEVASSFAGELFGATLAKHEDVTKVALETTRVAPAKPGEQPTTKLVVSTRTRNGSRIDTRKLEVEVPAGKLEAFRAALRNNDHAAMKALLASSKREETSRTAYEEKLPLGIGHSATRHTVRERRTEAE